LTFKGHSGSSVEVLYSTVHMAFPVSCPSPFHCDYIIVSYQFRVTTSPLILLLVIIPYTLIIQ